MGAQLPKFLRDGGCDFISLILSRWCSNRTCVFESYVCRYDIIRAMRTTLDIPDAMYRRIKMRTAQEVGTVRAITLTLLHRIRMVAAAAVLLAALPVCAAVEWRGLDKDNWCSGPVLTPEKLKGKVVLVDRWGVRCPPCRRSLPHIEALWK